MEYFSDFLPGSRAASCLCMYLRVLPVSRMSCNVCVCVCVCRACVCVCVCVYV